MKHVQASLDDGFDRFWAEYPKHVAKKDARKAWIALKPGADLVERMIAALRWQRVTPAWTKDGGAYIPYAATWIRAERWEDEPCDTQPLLGKQTTRLASALERIKAEGNHR